MFEGKFSHFSGRVVQVIEALDINDACSNHVIRLQSYFNEAFGVQTEVFAYHYHPVLASKFSRLSDLHLTEKDIVIYHYAGYSEYTLPYIMSQKATRVMDYHNITPHDFFEVGSPLYHFCKNGRSQLEKYVDEFDFFLGDSQYNLDEIIALGADRVKTFVVPIIVKTELEKYNEDSYEKKDLLFVGRIVQNKRQDKIVEFFSNVIREGYDVGKLILVGKYDKSSAFYKKLIDLITDLELDGRVVIAGEVDNDELNRHYCNAKIFLSFSEHEGFGVPLLEACRYGLPVLAYDAGAVKETLRNSPGVFRDDAELMNIFARLYSDVEFGRSLQVFQSEILKSLDTACIKKAIVHFLSTLIPLPTEFSTVSVVICTYNRADYLDRVLHYLMHQYDCRFEVVVVNGPSTDHTDTVINKWRESIKYFDNPARNLSVSRNIGIENSSGEIIAFIDDDAIPFADWIGLLIRTYNSVPYKVGGVGGITYFAGTFEYQADDIVIDAYGTGKVNPSYDDLVDVNNFRTLLGTNSSFKKKILEEIGGFDEEYEYFLDESDVCVRVIENNYLLLHCKDMFLRHEFAQSDNRVNNYKYNWYSICKNVAYFSCRFNGGYSKNVEDEIRRRIEIERIGYIKQGVREGVISENESIEMEDEIWRGVDAGLRQSSKPRKLLAAKNIHAAEFKQYPVNAADFKCLHIVLVTKEFPPFTKGGGVGTLYYHLASELLILGHHVSVVVQGKISEVYDRGRFKLYHVPYQEKEGFKTKSKIADRNLNWSLCVAQTVLSIHKAKPISVIDSCVWDAEIYALTVYKEKLKVPLVARLVTPFYVACKTNNWQISEEEVDLLMGMERVLVDNVDAVVPISDSITETFSHNYGVSIDERWRRIYAGITPWPTFDVGQGYEELLNMPAIVDAKKSEKKIFLFVGRLELRKGVDVLLKAINAFVSEYNDRNDFLFVLAGSDCMSINENVDEYLSSLSQKHVCFTGEVTASDREKLYNVADVVVFPSKYESFGLVPLEAFVHSTPVIGSNKGAIPEVVQDGVSGLIFDGDSPDELSECIKKLYLHDELLVNLSRGARSRVRELSSEKMANESINLYRDLIGIL